MIEMEKVSFVDILKDYLDYSKISNKEFAERINVTPKHLIEILSKKIKLSSDLIESIARVTSIPIEYIYKMENETNFSTQIREYVEEYDITEKQYLKKFNVKYLEENNWINFTDIKDSTENIKDILRFLRVSNPEGLNSIKVNALYKSKNDKPEQLLLWLEKCYKESLKQEIAKYKKENIENIVLSINEFALRNEFNEENLIKLFNDNGINLVIQEDIPGSKIRGAFKVNKDTPAIYITYKHRRIADIYFTLLHELAHCKTDFNKAKGMNLVSYEEEIDNEENLDNIEIRADNKAYDWMVNDKAYKDICDKVKQGKYDIKDETRIPKSFIVYRLAKDKLLSYSSKMYQEYNIILND